MCGGSPLPDILTIGGINVARGGIAPSATNKLRSGITRHLWQVKQRLRQAWHQSAWRGGGMRVAYAGVLP